MVVDAAGDEVLSLGVDDVVGSDAGDVGDVGATEDGGYAVVFDEYATYVLLAFVDDGGLVNQGGDMALLFLCILYRGL